MWYYLHVFSNRAAFYNTHRAVIHREATQTAVIISERFLSISKLCNYIFCDYESDIA